MAEITINESGKRAMQDAIQNITKRYDKRFDVSIQHTISKGQITFKIVGMNDDLIFQLGMAYQYYYDVSLKEQEEQ